MRAILFAPDRNTPGKHDAGGAFIPDSQAFAKHHGITTPIVRVDISADDSARRAQIHTALASGSGLLETVAFFCHGYRTGIQLGYTIHNVADLARAIAASSLKNVRVILYACSTGGGNGPGGDGAFADQLRDALCAQGATECQVDAHTTAAHATRNPYVRRFEGRGSPVGGTGGQWLVAPESKLWGVWRRGLNTDLRFRFPFMSVAQLHAELLAAREGVA